MTFKTDVDNTLNKNHVTVDSVTLLFESSVSGSEYVW